MMRTGPLARAILSAYFQNAWSSRTLPGMNRFRVRAEVFSDGETETLHVSVNLPDGRYVEVDKMETGRFLRSLTSGTDEFVQRLTGTIIGQLEDAVAKRQPRGVDVCRTDGPGTDWPEDSDPDDPELELGRKD